MTISANFSPKPMAMILPSLIQGVIFIKETVSPLVDQNSFRFDLRQAIEFKLKLYKP
jgi:hypothetical protein